MIVEDHNKKLRLLRQGALRSEGPERLAERWRRRAQSARERVLALLDPESFVELDTLVPGAVTGHGKVHGRDVYVFSQDGEVPPGSLDALFVRKVAKIADLAMKNGAPLIGFYDAGSLWGPLGAQKARDRERGEEEGASLGLYSELYFRSVMASGFIPQIAAVVGPCEGALAYSAVLSDFTVMVKGSSFLYLREATEVGGDDISVEQIAGARTQAAQNGLAHLAVDDELECIEAVRSLLGMLPQNNLEDPPRRETFDPIDRADDWLAGLGLPGLREPYDVREVIRRVGDDGEFLELMQDWAANLVVGFARLGGAVVGVVANQPASCEGRLDAPAARKGARFVRLCDAFNIPLLTLVDTPGFVEDRSSAGDGLRGAAQLLYAFCEATVPKVTVVTGRASGAAYEVMCPKHARADVNLAWASAQISRQPLEGALDMRESASPFAAAAQGLLDDVIEPAETRRRVIAALAVCVSKREERPPKKHGNVPL